MSFVAAAAIGAGGMIGASLLGGGGGGGKPYPMEPPWQTALRKELAEKAKPKAFQRLGRAGEPYPGKLVAPLSEYEQTGLEGLGKFLQTPLPTEGGPFAMAGTELEKTLGGEEYDPFEGAYYQAYRQNVMRELQEAKDRLAAQTSARDAYFGGGRIAATGELEETAMGGLQETLGGLYERERERRLGAVPMAGQYAAMGEGLPLGRVAAAQQYGALPRAIEQAQLSAEQAEWLRQLDDLGIPLEVAMGMSTYRPDYAVRQPSPSPFSQMAGPAGDIASAMIMAGAMSPQPTLAGATGMASNWLNQPFVGF